jgi:hypothetical protein
MRIVRVKVHHEDDDYGSDDREGQRCFREQTWNAASVGTVGLVTLELITRSEP